MKKINVRSPNAERDLHSALIRTDDDEWLQNQRITVVFVFDFFFFFNF